MKIGDTELGERPLFLAPMEDVTDASFRYICKEFGADVMYTEFVSSDGLIRDARKSLEKLKTFPYERPIGIQIYGHIPEAMVEAAKMAEEAQPSFIDINFGCPVNKIANRGAGSGMMRYPDKMVDITRRVVEAVKLPVTVKTRLGWDDNSKIIVELAEQLQECGIAALTLHGRTRAQMYKGEADWSLIAAVKNNPRMRIPIIGNGDVTSVEGCRQRFDETGVDAVMIGRGSIGQPWFFEEVKHYLTTGEHLPKKSFHWYLDILKEQIQQSVERTDEIRGILHNRRHLAASPIFKGIPDFKVTRIAMLRANTLEELFGIMDGIQEKYEVE